jgi:hypothetical protein
MAMTEVLKKVVGWLRAGYPEGVPEGDYLPLFALLGSHLSDDDINAVAEELESSSPPATVEAIRAALRERSDHKPLELDVARVRSRLAEGGWPLAQPHDHSEAVSD